jgi:ABC-2 type transport system permease protein
MMIETKQADSQLIGMIRSVGREANKSYAFVERGWYLTKRYWAWELVWIVYNVVNALSITFIATIPSVHISPAERDQLILYLAIGTAVWTYVSVVFDNVTETVTMERWEGTIEYTFMAPVSRLTHMLGTCLFALIHGILLTALQLVVLSLFFHLDMTHANWGAAIFILLLGSVSLIGLGTVSAILPMLFTERGAQMAYIIRAVMLLVSGVYYPVTVLPNWLQAVSKVTPTTYMLDGLRNSIQSNASFANLLPDIWPLLICGVVLVPLGQYIFHLAERYAKRTGKLKRNG